MAVARYSYFEDIKKPYMSNMISDGITSSASNVTIILQLFLEIDPYETALRFLETFDDLGDFICIRIFIMTTVSIQCSLECEKESAYSESWQQDMVPFKDEIRFDKVSGYLIIDFQKTCHTRLRIGTWQRGLDIWRWNPAAKTWEEEPDDPALFFPLNTGNEADRMAQEEFCSTIPAPVLDAVSPFKWRQLVLLKMVRQCPEMLELLCSNPVLAWLLADTVARKEIPLHDGCAWAFKKRSRILGFVGGPSTESAVRFVGKMRALKYSEEEYLQAMAIIKQMESFDFYRVLPVIPLDAIVDFEMDVNLLLWLNKLTNSDDEPLLMSMDTPLRKQTQILWKDTKAIALAIGVRDIVKTISRRRSIAGLQKLHDQWSRIMNAKQAQEQIDAFMQAYMTTHFPDPPLDGCAEIVPIRNIEDLVAEGKEMCHCVVSYSDKIMAGVCYIYRVLAPQRATLEVLAENGKYLPGQLKLKFNKKPSQQTLDIVEHWIQSQQQTWQGDRLDA